MYQSNLTFNKVRDKQLVDQFGFVDLNMSLRNGYVPNTLSSDSRLFNGIEDPASISGKPGDAFEVMRMEDNLSKAVKGHTAKQAASSEDKNE